MMLDRSEKDPGARFLLILASLVVVVFGLKLAAPILLPAAMALFLAVLSLPVMTFMQRRGLPNSVAIAVTMLVNVGVFGLVLLLASGSVSQLQVLLPSYATRLEGLFSEWTRSLELRLGLPLGDYLATDLVNPAAIVDFARGALGRIAQFVTATFVVLLITIFMLSEAIVFPAKIRFIFGEEVGQEDRVAKIVGEIQTYLGIKTVISLATGIILGVWCYLMGLDFPVLLGMVAFMLNYVPTVGSIIAAAPAILISLVVHGSLPHAMAVGAGYMVVNAVFGNLLEPNLMGRRLGLSTLVVILSLLFWGWTWGPIGALLSVPLTVIVKILLENTPDLRWVAVLLDKKPPGVSSAADGAADKPAI